MSNYKEIASKMAKNTICKAGIGNYVIYRRDFLFENFEKNRTYVQKDTYVLQKLLVYFHGSHHFVDLRNFKNQNGNCHANSSVG